MIRLSQVAPIDVRRLSAIDRYVSPTNTQNIDASNILFLRIKIATIFMSAQINHLYIQFEDSSCRIAPMLSYISATLSPRAIGMDG